MVLFNYSARELTAKIVYYGPGLCGKTTNLQVVYNSLPENVKGKMLSLATRTDRTLFFDFLPLDLGDIAGMKTRIQLYTVPGQVFYNETRKLVLTGSDGIVFVADCQAHLLAANIESFKNLEDNLRFHGINLKDLPLVLQFNKRDLPSLTSVEELNLALNKYNSPFYEAVATTGIGVQDTLRAITKLVLINLCKKFDFKRYEEIKTRPEAKRKDAPFPPEAALEEIKVAEEQVTVPLTEQMHSAPTESGPVELQKEEVTVGIERSKGLGGDAYAEKNISAAPERHGDVEPATSRYDEAEIEIVDDLEEIELLEEEIEYQPVLESEPVSSPPEPIAETAEPSTDTYAPEQVTAIDFELVEAPASSESATVEEKPEVKIAYADAKDITLPLTVEIGTNKVQINLVISFKFQDREDKAN